MARKKKATLTKTQQAIADREQRTREAAKEAAKSEPVETTEEKAAE
jgi:hypothetical protein